MKVPKSYEGKLVAVQLSRPVYIFEYGAHLKQGDQEQLVPKVIVSATVPENEALARHAAGQRVPTQETLRELISVATIKHVNEDSVTLEVLAPNRDGSAACLTEYLLPEELILSIVRVTEFEVDLPEVTVHQRAASPQQAAAGRVVLK